MSAVLIVVHGGVGAPSTLSDGCQKAVGVAMDLLQKRRSAIDAAVAAVVSLENDGRFNAGVGSVLRLDGKTMEMDAGVMDSTGLLGSVAAVRRVRNPVLVARQVAETPHVLLVGEGATSFAKVAGLESEVAPTEGALERYRQLIRGMEARDSRIAWSGYDLAGMWNFDSRYSDIFVPQDTVGAVVGTPDGTFAVAGSTGGSVPMLLGRVGDTPLIGSGFYAGAHGAVASTGVGEEISRRMLAREVYESMRAGATPQAACEAGLLLFPDKIAVGVIAVGCEGSGAASNREMPHAVR